MPSGHVTSQGEAQKLDLDQYLHFSGVIENPTSSS